ncbi:MAG: signal peptidase I [Bdellovibrionales bacterium]|nr:signal peptidase I [Bdellovibrionales bacterium]
MSDQQSTSSKTYVYREVVSFIKTLVACIAIAFFIKESVIAAYKIPSGSMMPTLLKGDHLLVTKFDYGLRAPFSTYTFWQYGIPKRGDVVVFTRPDEPLTPTDESQMDIIKRVIALPGETVEVHGTQVFINNKELKETDYTVIWEEGGKEDFGPVTVPDGHVFVMGDNRDHSKDSRFWVPSNFLEVSRIKGQALIIYWSFAELSRIGKVIY